MILRKIVNIDHNGIEHLLILSDIMVRSGSVSQFLEEYLTLPTVSKKTLKSKNLRYTKKMRWKTKRLKYFVNLGY